MTMYILQYYGTNYSVKQYSESDHRLCVLTELLPCSPSSSPTLPDADGQQAEK